MSAPSKADRVAEAASRHAERTRIRDEARERGRAIIASASDTFLREQTADDLEIAAEDARYAAACRRAALEALDDPAAVVEGHMTVEASKQFLTTLDQADAEYERVTGQKPESFFPVYPFIRRHPLYNGVWVRPGVLEHSAGNALGHAVAQLERDRKAGALLVTLHTDLIQVVTAVGRMAAGVPPPVPADAHDRLDAIFYFSPQARAMLPRSAAHNVQLREP